MVTGGCGFFGTWIVRKLLSETHRVTVLDLERVTKRWELLLTPEQITSIEFNPVRIEESELVRDVVLESRPDAIIHLAGLQVPACRANPLAGAKVNVLGTLSVFEAALASNPRPRVVYASSAAVFGSDADYDDAAVGDSSEPKPGTHYGAFKLCNEFCARAYSIDHGFSSVGLRPLTVYGPGRDLGITSAPTRAIAAAVMGQRFEIPFRGATTYTYAEEVADYFVAAALSPLEGAPVFTVGGALADTPAFISALERAHPSAAGLITCSGGDLPIAARLDDRELREAFPGVERVGLDEGVRKTIEVYREAAARGTLTI
jgi:nucleoside-diphosphate-sugar epimerase